jgi:hypothetical protein
MAHHGTAVPEHVIKSYRRVEVSRVHSQPWYLLHAQASLPPEDNPYTQWRLCGPQSRSGRFGEKNNVLTLLLVIQTIL